MRKALARVRMSDLLVRYWIPQDLGHFPGTRACETMQTADLEA